MAKKRKMKICFIADANSIHARRWISYFCTSENEIHVLSTTRCLQPLQGAIIHNLPSMGGTNVPTDGIGIAGSSQPGRKATGARDGVSTWLRSFVGRILEESSLYRSLYIPYKVIRFTPKAAKIVKELRPDLVHCLRLPVEGYIGGLIGYHPLALSTWGEDMVFFAEKSRLCRWLTTRAMSNADIYFPDSLRDKYLAEAYGFSASRPTFVVPVTGGLEIEKIPVGRKDVSAIHIARKKIGISNDTNLIISVRGYKAFYVDIEPLVRAVPKVIKVFPDTVFILRGNTKSNAYRRLKRMIDELGIEANVRLVDRLSAEELTDHFTASDIMISVTLWDGLPVSLLEGMAFGLIPLMSVHSPIQEWIHEGENGFFFDPKDPDSIARAIIKGLQHKSAFPAIREMNWGMLRERAVYRDNMKTAERFYLDLCGKGNQKAE